MAGASRLAKEKITNTGMAATKAPAMIVPASNVPWYSPLILVRAGCRGSSLLSVMTSIGQSRSFQIRYIVRAVSTSGISR